MGRSSSKVFLTGIVLHTAQKLRNFFEKIKKVSKSIYKSITLHV